MHESQYRAKASAILKARWPTDYFIEESYIPFGTERISDRRAYPDILRVFPNGSIGLVEVKKWGSSDLDKWKILGELQFYTFLIETQYKQDSEEYLWMFGLIRRGLISQATVDALEDRILKGLPVVCAWAILIIGGDKEAIEESERIWHLHEYVKSALEENISFRPMSILHYSERPGGDSVYELGSWFSRPDSE